MAVNWVMLSNEQQGFVNLPNEKTVYMSPPRTALSLQTPKQYPGNQPLSIHSSSGVVYLTNQRIVYLPATSTPQLQSFSAPLLNLHDSHVSAPFFGPNVWTAALQPVAGGGIPPTHALIELKLIFKEGGAFDFHSQFERIKERLQQAVESARDSGLMTGDGEDFSAGRGGGALAAVNLAAVHLDELPAYDGPGISTSIALQTSSVIQRPTPIRPEASPRSTSTTNTAQRDSRVPPSSNRDSHNEPGSTQASRNEAFDPPTGPPPGYEEAQQQSVASELERRLLRDPQD